MLVSEMLYEIYKDMREILEVIFDECMKGLNEEAKTNTSNNPNHYIYKTVELNEKVEFEDDEEDWTAV